MSRRKFWLCFLSLYFDVTFTDSQTQRVKITDKGPKSSGPLSVIFLLDLLHFLPAFLLVLLRRLWRQCPLRFLPLQLRQFSLHFHD